MCAAGGGSSTWGNTWESRGKAWKKLCASVTSISLVVFKPTSNIVLGAEIERALRAVQRDEGWNCKGAHSATIAIPGLGE